MIEQILLQDVVIDPAGHETGEMLDCLQHHESGQYLQMGQNYAMAVTQVNFLGGGLPWYFPFLLGSSNSYFKSPRGPFFS